ncbi:MAG: hypothetical protein PHX68_03250 [Alphaproteobacteria bacterium]|nr:hypothetical protein [Alphaproteobacteria bacterium]
MQLNEAIASRMNHDLSGSVCAAQNAVQLLDMSGTPAEKAEAVRLIADAAAAVATRLKFLRMMFGAPQPIDNDVVRAYLKLVNPGVSLDGEVATRLQLTCVAVLAHTAIGKSTIAVRPDSVSAEGMVKISPDSKKILQGGAAEVSPINAMTFWVMEQAKEAKKMIHLAVSERVIKITLV